jgi:hypothetical protein
LLSDTEGVDILTILDTVIVGAGQAGLGVSYFLQQNGRKHILFERERIGESWLSPRWDSFKLNTPNFMNVLPGLHYDGLETVQAQIYAGRTLVSTCMAEPGEICALSAESMHYDVFFKNGATGWEIARKIDSDMKKFTLSQDKSRYTIAGPKTTANELVNWGGKEGA